MSPGIADEIGESIALDAARELTGEVELTPTSSAVGPPSVSAIARLKGTLSCAPTAKMMPLTNNKAGLKTAIDGLAANGWTAGHLGTAWAWYTLSEKWASIWPTANRPGQPSEHLKKVAVLMTDGDYNTYYRNNTESRVQALALCQGMKAAGITVYTVAFGIDITAASKADLQACASSEQHFHDAQDGDALRQAFQTIAISLSQLRLTQ